MRAQSHKITVSLMKKPEGLKSPAKVCGTQKGTSKTCILKLRINILEILISPSFSASGRFQFENCNLFISHHSQHVKLKINLLNVYYDCFLDF